MKRSDLIAIQKILQPYQDKIDLLSQLAQMHEEDIEELTTTVNLLEKKLQSFLNSINVATTARKPTKKSTKKK